MLEITIADCAVAELPIARSPISIPLVAGTFAIWTGPELVSIAIGPVPSPTIRRLEGADAPIENGAYVPGVTQTTETGLVAALTAAWIEA